MFSWDNNCAATDDTNGIDERLSLRASSGRRRYPRAALLNPGAGSVSELDLPSPLLPTLQTIKGNNSMMKSFILPGNNTGVVRTTIYLSVLHLW